MLRGCHDELPKLCRLHVVDSHARRLPVRSGRRVRPRRRSCGRWPSDHAAGAPIVAADRSGRSVGCRHGRHLALGPGRVADHLGNLGSIGILIVMGQAALSESPFDFEPLVFAKEDERAFAERLRQSRPAPDEPRILRLTGNDLNGLLNAALIKAGGRHKAHVTLLPDECTVQMSLAGPASWPRRFLNIEMTGHGHVDYGKPVVAVHQLHVGGRRIPWPLNRLLASVAVAALQCEPRVSNLLGAVTETTVRPDELELLFHAGKVGQDIVASLMQIVWERPDIAAETRIYTEYLLDVAERTPRTLDRLPVMTQAAFELAQERSAAGGAQLENRAAIVALAMLLGHTGVEPLVGKVFTDATRRRAERVVGTARLQGRADWPRHFLVSAAIKLLSDTDTSDSLGVFKEQIDAQDGGSGFSFADMLANMAGIRLAMSATATESSARAVQERLALSADFTELFPPAGDLPEGFSAEALEAEYGGTKGARYLRMMQELDDRLDRLPALVGPTGER